MRSSPFASFILLLGAVAGAAAAQADADVDVLDAAAAAPGTQTAAIYVQPVAPLSSALAQPSLLAEIRFDAGGLAEVASYEAPDALEQDKQDEQDTTLLYRIGLYDPVANRWLSATSVTAASNFAKGYQPHFVLTVAKRGSESKNSFPIAAAVRGLPIDAGATRDFGPQATVVQVGAGKTPALNRPVVLSPEGKKLEEPEEKTFLQKYWWMIAIGVLVLTMGGGDK